MQTNAPMLCRKWLQSKCLPISALVLATVSCPNCHQSVDSQAVTCPHCRIQLKAFGHPGIPLHRATGKGYLCDNCTYHADDSCNFPQRPFASLCTLYENIEQTKLEMEQQRYATSKSATIKSWIKRNQGLLLLLSLLLICLFIVISTS